MVLALSKGRLVETSNEPETQEGRRGGPVIAQVQEDNASSRRRCPTPMSLHFSIAPVCVCTPFSASEGFLSIYSEHWALSVLWNVLGSSCL